MVDVVKVKRVPYGKSSTPEELREYTIVGSGSSAVGTLAEIEMFLKDRGIEATLEVVE